MLRVGLLVDEVEASKYVFELADWANNQSHALAITHLILHPRKLKITNGTISGRLGKLFNSLKNEGVQRTIAKILYRLIIVIETVLLRRIERHKNHFDSFDLTSVVPEQITITPLVSKSGFVYRFEPADVEKVRSLNLDLLIRCGRGILRGEILTSARLGIVSFHHADNRINRGGPPAFWEVYLAQDTTGFTIQRLTDELDGGDVIARGHFQTKHYYLLNEATLYDRSNRYMKLLLTNVATTGSLPTFLPSFPYSKQLFRVPNAYEASRYLIKFFIRQFRNLYRRLRKFEDFWTVAYTYSDWRSAVLWRGKTIISHPSCWLADPFVVSKNGKDYCFVEEFNIDAKKARIAVYELSPSGAVRLGTALEEAFHLSFPYTFEYQDELYMCPETQENRDIRIYKCVDFPLVWKLEKILKKNIHAVDTMLFEKNSKLWMFTNIDYVGDGDFGSELSIFYADSLFSDEWSPHPLNPIFVDAGRARNAGLVRNGDSYFRISQGQGLDIYGKRSLINEILELSVCTYSEATVSENNPDFAAGLIGTHHMHSNGKVTVYDFLKTGRITR